ncbi:MULTISPECIES: branched-chain amino acid ABC transporter permease [Caloramator]|jgi:branched-chain amino acid transport system permease protein|uniref:High-affinity branched-chain amino acid transport system permease protein LivH (TC 3.A.1.4.1) n=1 Tax=Caloramator australicus RC3 TaxID=857293 RepID=I7LHS8_9CLOT|nr:MULTISPECIES: branched-chain amino acid ABC transporter permease [Caloramator]MDO6355582.1 branched-chain amino acid ABC transporter permease [Caloramator sp. CAR-1]WDU82011.1 branched-chain amino acid ABC transporter permease [Caloramator sp. Dgby_cultured_2]CCJ34266.1 High-affinity branched-chain amino acid transport system permease protein LivH (TC 3.A.1.4.1) [Caloramator australicus RC3]
MSGFIQQIINGLSIGSVYALMAVGYSLVYSIMNFSNFAHGGIIMFGAYFGFFFMTLYKFPFSVAFIASGICAALMAILVERVAYKPLRDRRAPFLYFIISAMGVSIFLENIIIATIGPTFRTYPEVFSAQPIKIGNLAIGRIDLTMFIISAVFLVLLIYLIDHTKIGKAIQATSFNMKASALMGINTDFIILLVFGLGGFLAGLAGVLFGMKYTVYPQIGNITLKSFIAAVFGGLGSLQGAVIGSVLLGIIETITSGYISSQYRDLIAFVLLIFILVVRPMGLMGKVTEDKA